MAIGEDLRPGCLWRAALAEAVASLLFVALVLGSSAAPGAVAPALGGGLAAAALSSTPGAPQANPALTLALLCTRKLSAGRAAAAVLAQCCGALLAAAAARLVLPAGTGLVTRVSAEATAGQALAWETLATIPLALATFTSSSRAPPHGGGGLILGSAVAAGALAAGPVSGGSLNPARSLGPALVTGVWDNHWVYWLGPVLGSVLAGLCHELLLAPGASRDKLRSCLPCRDVALVEATSPAPSSPPPRSPTT
ncbi:aquaporin-4-like [Ara ararauna]